MKRVHPRRLITSLLAAGLLAAALVPAASAAPPRWTIAVTQLNPGAISAGSSQGFDIHIENRGPSNISQLYLIDNVPDATTYISSTRTGCSAVGAPLSCTFGALRAGATIDVRVAFPMPAGASTFNVTFELNSTGLVTGGNNSHGDAAKNTQTVTVLPANGNRAAAWTFTAGANLGNGQVVGTGNLQATRVSGIGQFVPVDIADGSDVSFNCPKSKCKAKVFGEWSDVNVDNGRTFPTAFGIQITVAKSALPAGFKSSDTDDVFLYHVLANGSVETISQACGATVPATGCIDDVFLDQGNLVIQAHVHYNGGYKGAF